MKRSTAEQLQHHKEMLSLARTYKDFSDYVTAYIELLGITRETIAKECDISRGHLYQIEKKLYKNPRLNILLSILQYLKKKGAEEIDIYRLSIPSLTSYTKKT